MTRPQLHAVPAPETDDEGEIAVMPPEARPAETPTEVLGAPAEDVRLAVDPPQGHLGVADLLGIDLPEHRLIVPRWAKSWADARAVASWCLRYVLSLATFHLTRAPVYAVRSLVRSIVGTWRAVVVFQRWLWDAEGRAMAHGALVGNDPGAWKSARKEWHETVHRRLLGCAIALGVAALALVLTYYLALPHLPPALAPAVGVIATLLVLIVLVRLGAPEDKPLVDTYYTSKPGDSFRLTSRMIVVALKSLGIANINQALKEDPKDGIRFPKPITTDGPGFRAEVDLPHGVTAAQVMEKRTELASGLRRPLGTVWPEPAPDVHAGRLVLWVGNQEMAKLNKAAPYARADWKCNAFGEVPFGFDQRGRAIAFEVIYQNILVGSLPGGGKTGAVRGLLLALSLDPTVELRISEHKGSGDLSMFEEMAHFYVSGVADDDVEATLLQLRGLLKECERRGKQIKHLGKTSDLAPDSKVTRQTASMRHLGLHPIVFVIDEAQEVFGHDEHGKEAGKLAERVIKRGRALGITLVIATQRPDKDSLPTGITANVSIRFCLRVGDQVTNDMILGTSAYKQGVQATTLSPKDQGVGYLKGAHDQPVVVRSYYMSKPEAEKVAKRALGWRRAAGTITGQAAGEAPEQEQRRSLADDLTTVFATCEVLHSEDVITRLTELAPGTYDGWKPTTLAAAVKDQLAIGTSQVKIAGRNRQGLRRDAVLDAVAARITARALPVGGETEGDQE